MRSGNCGLTVALLVTVTALVATPASAERGEARADRPSVTVSGSGEIKVVPDTATVNAGAEFQVADVDEGAQQVNAVIKRVIAAATELGIEPQDIQAAGMVVAPNWQWDQKQRTRNQVGYTVTRNVTLQLRRLDKLAQLMAVVTEAGANRVSGVSLSHSRAAELQRDALARAAEDARLNAQVLARTLGVGLGSVHRIQATPNRPMPMPQMRGMAMAAEAAPDSGVYESGEIRINAQVTAEFNLLHD